MFITRYSLSSKSSSSFLVLELCQVDRRKVCARLTVCRELKLHVACTFEFLIYYIIHPAPRIYECSCNIVMLPPSSGFLPRQKFPLEHERPQDQVRQIAFFPTMASMLYARELGDAVSRMTTSLPSSARRFALLNYHLKQPLRGAQAVHQCRIYCRTSDSYQRHQPLQVSSTRITII